MSVRYVFIRIRCRSELNLASNFEESNQIFRIISCPGAELYEYIGSLVFEIFFYKVMLSNDLPGSGLCALSCVSLKRAEPDVAGLFTKVYKWRKRCIAHKKLKYVGLVLIDFLYYSQR
jgi:hypothetical protein